MCELCQSDCVSYVKVCVNCVIACEQCVNCEKVCVNYVKVCVNCVIACEQCVNCAKVLCKCVCELCHSL